MARQITFLQLEAFVAIADMGSFEAAGRKLGSVQSGVSRHVRELESQFQKPLFDRGSRSARLTVDGLEVLSQARTILQQRDALLSQYASEKVLRRSLRLGVTELAALTWLPGFIDALRSTYPLVDVELEVGGVAVELYEKLRLAQLDLAIVPDTPRWADIVRFPLANVRNGWFCSPAFSLKRRRLAVSDLGQLTLLSQSADSAVGHVMSEWLERNGVQPRSILTCNNFAALGGMASAGLGIACLPDAISGELVALGLLRAVHVTPVMPPVRYVAAARQDALTPFHRKVITLARATCNYGMRYQDARESLANEAE
ncbi:LysR family transcriptional regulator [Paraburkholderia fungorum]|uniref:LysR family transcriptional regulator n=1 Tax=Paraburkholderia fungorum TaxID=134537 RepID=UPI001C1EF713|nr:LysR family transcriptional regulator [Paraburkholderia fungorum]MBU7438053.1 LysR family transcriptional regulator [Paraburkholderia fungorum]USU19247.1 LysR family transcriptional regulator [Paraburkholderia fungorum]USU28757.1 LysR family transcriptional regulator [Paraburkholderia fungorum]